MALKTFYNKEMTRCVALAYVCRKRKIFAREINQTYIIIPDFQDCPAFHITSVGDGRYHSCIFASPRYWLVIVLFYNDIACVNAIFLQDMHLKKLINTGGCQNHTTYWGRYKIC